MAHHSRSLYEPCYKTTPNTLNLLMSNCLDVEFLIVVLCSMWPKHFYPVIWRMAESSLAEPNVKSNILGRTLHKKESYSSSSIYQSV